jgi:LIVCS family branched-chain amino acid:cation transporter
MVFSCLTTAVALNNIYARYLCSTLRLKDQSFPLVLLGTTLISFTISLLDFRGIALFLAPALEISYPGLIVLTIASIFTSHYRSAKITLFWSITAFMIIVR